MIKWVKDKVPEQNGLVLTKCDNLYKILMFSNNIFTDTNGIQYAPIYWAQISKDLNVCPICPYNTFRIEMKSIDGAEKDLITEAIYCKKCPAHKEKQDDREC